MAKPDDRSRPDNVNMQKWPDRRLLDLLNIEIPFLQAPMAGSDSVALALAVSSAGALGSLACALLDVEGVAEAVGELRHGSIRPFNLNFFCHAMEAPDSVAIENWRAYLRPHYERWELDVSAVAESRLRQPFDEDMCATVEELKPEVVSFHFGLPSDNLVQRLKRCGIKNSVLRDKWGGRQDGWNVAAAMPSSLKALKPADTGPCFLRRTSPLRPACSRYCLK